MSVKVNATFGEKRVLIPSGEDAEPLLQGGYGYRRENKEGSVLSPWEALYLLAENRLIIYDGETRIELDFQSLLSRFRAFDENVWSKYLIYRDLRSRGYVVRDGVGLGVDFRLYARGTYGEKAAKYIVYAICEGTPMLIKQIQQTLFIAQNMKKQLIIAVMDRRGEIVYYSLSQFNLF
jgi:tRNA-intron endonuclease